MKSTRVLSLILLVASFLAILPAAEHPVSAAANGSRPQDAATESVLLPGVRPNPPTDQSGYIRIPYSAALNPLLGVITIEAWVKRNGVNRHETIVGNGWQTSYWFGFSPDGRLRFTPNGANGFVDGNAVVPTGEWVHVAVTYDGITCHFYINGVLDKSSNDGLGWITPAPAGQAPGIGFDVNDTFTPNYFGGRIDNLRIWKMARSAVAIKSTMFQAFGKPETHLLAEWSFDGNANDPAGGHDGVLQGQVEFDNEGAIPHDIRIPQVNVTPGLDGLCQINGEYANAVQVTVDGVGAWLLHTASDLWVCMSSLPNGISSGIVYLDAQYTRLDPAQPEHLMLQVNSSETTGAFVGAGNGDYTATNAADGHWAGVFLECCGGASRGAEFRIGAELVGGWDHTIGLALGKSLVVRPTTVLDLWPALAAHNLPSTWSAAILGGGGAARTFSGQVVYQPRDDSAATVGIPDASIELIGSDANGSEALVATTQSDLNGDFTLTTDDSYTRHRLELGSPPKGYAAQSVEGAPPAVKVDERTLDYGSAGAGAYPNNLFILGDALPSPVDAQYGPYFLIIAAQQIINDGALDAFVDFKSRQGFAVEVISVETINGSYSGDSLRDKIRAAEQARLTTYGSRFRYVLLVGTDSVLPYVQIYPWFNGKTDRGVDLDGCLMAPTSNGLNAAGVKLKYSDWYYADLVSEFDSNQNGCLLDGVLSSVLDWAPGYFSDSRPTFQATVAVGRIPFETADAVRKALANSMGFEQQSHAFKQRALHAMSNVYLKGRSWIPKDSQIGNYVLCPIKTANKNCQSYTADPAFVSEFAKMAFLNMQGYLSTILYEQTKPPGAVPVQSPQPLTAQNLLAALEAQDYGLVNVAGHGGAGGVSRTYWSDENGNGQVDSPTAPLPLTSVEEIKGNDLLTRDGLKLLTADDDHGAIYIVGACSTGNPWDQDNFGASLLAGGHGVAWVGGLSMVGVGSWVTPSDGDIGSVQYNVMERLLNRNLRLGDAVWQTLEYQVNHFSDLSAGGAVDLFGDPTLSYWGNPGGQSTLAAWPMLRYDARGQGFLPLAGPDVPKKQWDYPIQAPGAGSLLPSPVVSNLGEVVVAHGNNVDVLLRTGVLLQRLSLDNAAHGAPAIAADGTIYALDTTGKLYAFPHQTAGPNQPSLRHRRWALSLGAAARTSPIVGADGFIAIGIAGKIALVRPDGLKHLVYALPGDPIGALAAGADRAVYAVTTTTIGRIDLFCANPPCVTVRSPTPANSTPPLLAHGAVYVGRSNGDVVKLTANGLVEQAVFNAGSAISTGPVAGPGGQVLVGTANGLLYSLTKNLALRWQRNVGALVKSAPAFSADALYITSGGKLRAYSPVSGAPLWTRNLNNGAGDGSVAVDYGRQLYVLTNDGVVYGFGEGWSIPILAVAAKPAAVSSRVKGFRVEWVLSVSQLSGAGTAPASVAAPQAAVGILLQRSADGGPWEDVATLPPGTTVFTDTGVLENESYAYRVQVLDSAGNDSDFTNTPGSSHSLPPLPQTPTLQSVTAAAADALTLTWSSPAADVVTGYRIERSDSAGGPFATALEASGGVTQTLDVELTARTTYFYRVIALNDTGESNPSAIGSGTTRQQTLAAPQNVIATLLDGWVQFSWDAGPAGAATAIEVSEPGVQGYQHLATAEAAGPYSSYPGEIGVYAYRLKFVLGNAESAYTDAGTVSIAGEQLYLPLISR